MEYGFVMLKEEEFDIAFGIMEVSFPVTEMRTYEGQKALLGNGYYQLYGAKDKVGNILAFIGAWEMEGFIFVEHFAVAPSFRGQGLGAEMLHRFIREKGKDVILEVELPDSKVAKRRIRFYEKAGFYLNEYGYLQPPLREGNPLLPLKIMTWPEKIGEKKFLYYREQLYKIVYKY